MQYWPRKRARRVYPKIRSWAQIKEVKPLGFAGYKVGMAHAIIVDSRKNSMTKGEEISIPITLLECPPVRVIGVRCYEQTPYGFKAGTEVLASIEKEFQKDLGGKLQIPKKQKQTIDNVKPEQYAKIALLVATQPRLTGIGNKLPEIFEVAVGGTVTEQFAYAKANIGKELSIEQVFQEGQQLDVHAVTKGKGTQGPVKRFGVSLRQHKSEKTRRGPGSLGSWNTQMHIMYRVAHAGKMGFHTRTEHNKWLLKIEKEMSKVTCNGGWMQYGVIKNPAILVHGSIAGPAKRLVRLTVATRPNRGIPAEAPEIQKLIA
ncbi:50S ribosomal protein L3 [Candidatus Woesearchaeota archaeon]|nr:50S ribosomal protein L3 [Candidatus Woesearchaeota archaeon]